MRTVAIAGGDRFTAMASDPDSPFTLTLDYVLPHAAGVDPSDVLVIKTSLLPFWELPSTTTPST